MLCRWKALKLLEDGGESRHGGFDLGLQIGCAPLRLPQSLASAPCGLLDRAKLLLEDLPMTVIAVIAVIAIRGSIRCQSQRRPGALGRVRPHPDPKPADLVGSLQPSRFLPELCPLRLQLRRTRPLCGQQSTAARGLCHQLLVRLP